MSPIFLYILAVIVNALNLFCQVFFAVMYSDLDYINPVDLCNKINYYILPEAIGHAILAFLLLVHGEWLSFFLNAPLLAFNIQKYVTGNYLLDATEIFRTVNKYKKEAFVKLGFYLILFFYYLYAMIMAIVTETE